MFKCQVLNKFSKPGEKCTKIVIKTRNKTYREKVWEEGELVEIETGKGWEIVKEINASDSGAELWNSWSEEERQHFYKSF